MQHAKKKAPVMDGAATPDVTPKGHTDSINQEGIKMTTAYRTMEVVSEPIRAHYSALLRELRRKAARCNAGFSHGSPERQELDAVLQQANLVFTSEPDVWSLRSAYKKYVWKPAQAPLRWVGDLPGWATEADVDIDTVGGEASVMFYRNRGANFETAQMVCFHLGTGVVTSRDEITTHIDLAPDNDVSTDDLQQLSQDIAALLSDLEQAQVGKQIQRPRDYCAEPQQDGIGGGL